MLAYRESGERVLAAARQAGHAGVTRYWLDAAAEAWEYVKRSCQVGEAVAVGSGVDGFVLWLANYGDAGYGLHAFAPVDERRVAPIVGLHKCAGSSETRQGWIGWWAGSKRDSGKSGTNVAFAVGDRVISTKPGRDGIARLAKVASVAQVGEAAMPQTVILEEHGKPVPASIASAWAPVYAARFPGFDALWSVGSTQADSYLILRTKLYNATCRLVGRKAASAKS